MAVSVGIDVRGSVIALARFTKPVLIADEARWTTRLEAPLLRIAVSCFVPILVFSLESRFHFKKECACVSSRRPRLRHPNISFGIMHAHPKFPNLLLERACCLASGLPWLKPRGASLLERS